MENGDDDEACINNAGLLLLLVQPPPPPWPQLPLDVVIDAATGDVPTAATTNSTAILIAMVRKRQNGITFPTTAAILPPFSSLFCHRWSVLVLTTTTTSTTMHRMYVGGRRHHHRRTAATTKAEG
jgi:hypothetical protein